MKRSIRQTLSLAGVASLSVLGLAACGGNSNKTTCAAGTTLQNDMCVPDGSVICGQGTVYDMTAGMCVPDPSACADGTVLVDGKCVPDDDTLTADAEEAAEPNDTSGAGDIQVPVVGDPGYVIHGCITPRDGDTTADLDPWFITVTGPTLLDITADGVHGLAAGFDVQTADANLAALDANGWVRFGVNLTGDTSSRQVFLPTAGSYALVLADSRQLFLSEAVAGTADTCYYTTIKQLAIPSPTAITSATTTGTIGGDVKFYSITPAEGDFLDGQVDMPAGSASASVVAQVNDDYKISGEASVDFFGSPIPAEAFFGGLKAADSVVFVVDPEFNYGIAPADFTLTLGAIHAQALPTDGSDLTTTEGDGVFLPAYFDVTSANELVHFDMSFADDSSLVFVDQYFGTVGAVSDPRNGDTPIPSFNGWVRFAQPGRYYAAFYHPDLSVGDTSTVTSTMTSTTAAAIAVGTPVTGASLVDDDSGFYSLDPGANPWLAFNAGATGFGGDVGVAVYDDSEYGALGYDMIPVTAPYDFNPDGSDTYGAIVKGLTSHYLLQVQDTGGSTGATFDLSVAPRAFTDLGAVTEATPVAKTGETLAAAGDHMRYLVTGTAGDDVTVTITPATGLDAVVDRLNRDESSAETADEGAEGEAETFKLTIGAQSWVAFDVTGFGTETGTFDVSVTAVSPVPYTIANSSVAFSDACTGGTTLPQTADAIGFGGVGDESLTDAIDLPFAFDLFGQPVTQFIASSNGWLSFDVANLPDDASFIDYAFPTTSDPNGVVGPYWADLENVVICEKVETGKVTIQWSGNAYGDTTAVVETQLVLHDDGSMDMVWGGNQVDDGSDASIGLENLTGSFGHQIELETAGSVAASTSKTLTPMP
jgi:hypothetical protein